jgi:uncharacterized protein (DUF1697 family)
MPVVISMLRGVNLGSHNRIRMEALRALYASLELRDPETYVQSGNVIFKTGEQDLAVLASRVEKGIERTFGFHSDVLVRTLSELREVVAMNPFAQRRGIDPAKLLVTFLASAPGAEVRDRLLALNRGPEELRIDGRELYVYFPNGMARPKLSWAAVQRTLETPATGRNWNSVRKMLEIAERLEASPGPRVRPGATVGGPLGAPSKSSTASRTRSPKRPEKR